MINTSKLIKLIDRIVIGQKNSSRALSTMMTPSFDFDHLLVSNPKEFVYQVQLNRPDKLNALNDTMWKDVGKCFEKLGDSPDCRVILLTGAGKCFSAGLDLHDAMNISKELADHQDIARRCQVLDKKIKSYQDAFLRVEQCPKPVIAAVHGTCLGGALELISATDIRYCSTSAWFALKEVDVGLAADTGGLQWLSKIIGSASLVRELAFTARKITADEALQCGLVNRLFKDDQTLFAESLAIAEQISRKSPVAVQTTKKGLIYSRDHSVQEGMDYMRYQNQAMLQSEDFINSAVALATKGDAPTFSKL
ncbi:hypothetical protein PV327_008326 [Microctonus hyperodae]|uniref:Delta(3,5)-Delta(2,4)-dienoyl-CoA isomerase, mitochondrial n=1 Tax=Microctonus hyperodae TaxID=165561 RepID=A0AA39F2W5_MICHY|nr:hypothetical protein PV327_008326 [Microctonus hyperodae]